MQYHTMPVDGDINILHALRRVLSFGREAAFAGHSRAIELFSSPGQALQRANCVEAYSATPLTDYVRLERSGS